MKKYFSIISLVLILAAIVFTSDQSVKVIKHIIVSNTADKEDQIVIVIDPGHPRICMG